MMRNMFKVVSGIYLHRACGICRHSKTHGNLLSVALGIVVGLVFAVASGSDLVAQLDQSNSDGLPADSNLTAQQFKEVQRVAPFSVLDQLLTPDGLVAERELVSPAHVSMPFSNSPVSQQRQQDGPLTAQAVKASIKFGVGFLKGKQRKDGDWPEFQRYDGGVTALVVLALVNSGEKGDSVRIIAALDYLRSKQRLKVYCVALRVMAMAAADPTGQRFKVTMTEDVNWLLDRQLANGGWTYAEGDGFRSGDASNSQFAILALHEAASLGIKVPAKSWQLSKRYWRSLRNRDGGFRYNPPPANEEPRGSMTCAGIASNIIIDEHLLDAEELINGNFAKCCNGEIDDVVESAFQWLASRYTVRTNPLGRNRSKRDSHLYYLYALERAGRFSGRRFIGENDWYRDGAKMLLGKQLTSGAWVGVGPVKEDNALIATCYALLFLSKGKRPVAIGKLDHGVADWDSHPKGVHYLTRRLEQDWNQKLNWQTVKAKGATVDDLFEAPVLFLSGKQLIGLDANQKTTLKQYIENGGFLFAEACDGDGCNGERFDSEFQKLMIEIFPDSELQVLDQAHPIWNAQYALLPSLERPLLGLQACCRTSVVYCPKNLSCYWSLGKPAVLESNQVPIALKQRVEYALQVGVNVVAYATGRQLKEKLGTQTVDTATKLLNDRALVLPKLSHTGGADDAPNAWKKVLKEVRDGIGLEINTAKKMISPTPGNLMDHPFIFIHGRNRVEFTQAERDAIKLYLERGGLILADSICASEAFTESFRQEMTKIIGVPLGAIAANHDLWTNEQYGEPLQRVTLRFKDARAQGGFRESIQSPEMEGVEVDGRLAVIFSPFDLSCALENTAVSNCTGYTRDDAMRIASKIILYSLRAEAVRR